MLSGELWSGCRGQLMVLPLLERAREQSATFLLTHRDGSGSAYGPHCSTTGESVAPRIPHRALREGEQYRFHFDMTKCIGCKCCVVACNEQNGNPAEINWRRVGEIEGGWYPNTQRLHLSMGCNHCLEPTCLTGCPVDAYTKDPITGVVIAQRGYLHRLPVLHVELFLRSAPIQPGARCGRQMRYVPQPVRGGARTGVRGSVSRRAQSRSRS